MDHAVLAGWLTGLLSAWHPKQVSEYAINIAGFGMPAAVLEQANALRFLGRWEHGCMTLIA